MSFYKKGKQLKNMKTSDLPVNENNIKTNNKMYNRNLSNLGEMIFGFRPRYGQMHQFINYIFKEKDT